MYLVGCVLYLFTTWCFFRISVFVSRQSKVPRPSSSGIVEDEDCVYPLLSCRACWWGVLREAAANYRRLAAQLRRAPLRPSAAEAIGEGDATASSADQLVEALETDTQVTGQSHNI